MSWRHTTSRTTTTPALATPSTQDIIDIIAALDALSGRASIDALVMTMSSESKFCPPGRSEELPPRSLLCCWVGFGRSGLLQNAGATLFAEPVAVAPDRDHGISDGEARCPYAMAAFVKLFPEPVWRASRRVLPPNPVEA